MSPSDLPQFTVTAVQVGKCAGRFDPTSWIGEGWAGCLLMENGRFAQGRFREVDRIESTCAFVFKDPTLVDQFSVGQSYPYMDSYWGERAELVLDTTRIWKEAEFHPTDAVRFHGPQGRMETRSTPDLIGSGELVPGGWDHEHCSICQRKIGCGGLPNGFVNAEHEWVCAECYNGYFIPRSIAFAHWTS